MKAVVFFIFVLKYIFDVNCDFGGILQIHHPSILIATEKNGSIFLQSGQNGSVFLLPGPDGGSVYYDGEDILHLIEVIKALPPVWKEHSPLGFFYTAYGGDILNVQLQATDPDNSTLVYTLVAGTMPPGLHINSAKGRIYGVVPDSDAMYSFTLRVTNLYEKYADAAFRMEIIERNQCIIYPGPCQNGGQCHDEQGNIPYLCSCPKQYSGRNCEIDCRNNTLGVKTIVSVPNAMMTGYLTKESFEASNGRLDSVSGKGMGWCGVNANAWLQIDLGQVAQIYAVTSQSYNSTFYTDSYYVSYSTDGSNFQNVTQINSTTNQLFAGSSGSSHTSISLPKPFSARFVRIHPVSYGASSFPCLRIDLTGCFEDGSKN